MDKVILRNAICSILCNKVNTDTDFVKVKCKLKNVYSKVKYKFYYCEENLTDEEYNELFDLVSLAQNIDAKQYLYIIENSQHQCKIGISKNPKRRKSEIKNACEINQIYISKNKYANARQIEKELHQYFKDFHAFREWFNIDFNIVKNYFIENDI